MGCHCLGRPPDQRRKQYIDNKENTDRYQRPKHKKQLPRRKEQDPYESEEDRYPEGQEPLDEGDYYSTDKEEDMSGRGAKRGRGGSARNGVATASKKQSGRRKKQTEEEPQASDHEEEQPKQQPDDQKPEDQQAADKIAEQNRQLREELEQLKQKAEQQKEKMQKMREQFSSNTCAGFVQTEGEKVNLKPWIGQVGFSETKYLLNKTDETNFARKIFYLRHTDDEQKGFTKVERFAWQNTWGGWIKKELNNVRQNPLTPVRCQFGNFDLLIAALHLLTPLASLQLDQTCTD